MDVLSVCLSTFKARFSDFISGFCDYIKNRACFKSFDFSCFKAFVKKNLAFTLAETLVVMGIIGVVAALTIPNLSSTTNNAQQIARFKKVYAEISAAHDRATAVYGPVETWFVNDNCTPTGVNIYSNPECTKRYFGRLIEFLKTQKICENTTSGCMNNSTIYHLNFESYGGGDKSLPAVILARGASFYLFANTPSCESSCGAIRVDIDGPEKGKNTLGIDWFIFEITKNGVRPWSYNDCFSSGYSCGEWIMKNGNMDYIIAAKYYKGHKDDAENPASYGQCSKNGPILSSTVTSCK